MNIFQVSNILISLLLFVASFLEFYNFINLTPCWIIFLGVYGVFACFKGADILAREGIIRSDKRRFAATFIAIVIFLSVSFLVFYPMLGSGLALSTTIISIAVGFTLTEWYVKAKRYDKLIQNQ